MPTTRCLGVCKYFSIKTKQGFWPKEENLIHHAIESKHDGIHAQNKSTTGEQYWKSKKNQIFEIKPKKIQVSGTGVVNTQWQCAIGALF